MLDNLLPLIAHDKAAELAPIPRAKLHQVIVDWWTGVVRVLLLAKTVGAQVGGWGYFVDYLPDYSQATGVVNRFGHLGVLTTELGEDRPILVVSELGQVIRTDLLILMHIR